MYKILIGLFLCVLILPFMGPIDGQVKMYMNILTNHVIVNNDKIIDYDKYREFDAIVISDLNNVTEIIIPEDIEDPFIFFSGDIIENNEITLKNDLLIKSEKLDVFIEILHNTNFGGNLWDGYFLFPQPYETKIVGQQDIISFQFGSDSVSLFFDIPFKITFVGDANKNVFINSVGYQSAQITTMCNSSNIHIVSNIPDIYPMACYGTFGDNLFVITKHASVFSSSVDIQKTPSSPVANPSKNHSGGGNNRINVPLSEPLLPTDIFIPTWNKKITQSWINGIGDESLFFSNIDTLVSLGLLDAVKNSEKKTCPSWIKITSQFWVNSQISDQQYLNSLQWLLDEKIIIT